MANSAEKELPRILLLIQLPPPVHGVSLMNSYILESECIRNSFHIDLIDFKFSTSMEDLQKFSFEKIFLTLKYGCLIIRKVLSFKPELVYFTIMPTGFGFYRDAVYVLLLKMFRVKVVLHLHGKGIKKNASNYFKRKLYQSVFDRTHVICLTQKLAEDITTVYKRVPFIVPNGIKVSKHEFTDRSHRDNTAPKILFLSNFMTNKGLLILIEALAILKHEDYKFTANLVGAHFDLSKEILEALLAKHSLTSCTKILGPLHGDQKFQQYEEADIFVFPTLNEAFGLVNLEAMQYSLPVIATTEGSIPDIVIENETGLLVQKGDADMLAIRLGVLLKDADKRVKMGRKGYERFIDNYTLDHFTKRLHSTLNEMILTARDRQHALLSED